jgi:glycerol-3-phosphate acyltransferase PlsX
LAQAAYPLLKENKQINFIGNIEGRDILLTKADVLVCEGFTGNVVLKLAESIYDIVKRRNIHDEHLTVLILKIWRRSGFRCSQTCYHWPWHLSRHRI